MLILYSILVLSLLSLIGVSMAVYCRVRKHMRASHDVQSPPRIPPESSLAPSLRPERARMVAAQKFPGSL
jgi:hypothetical protein